LGKNYSTFAIAQMLHVDPGSVANWIDQGLLKAYRTPGGHRRVTAGNLLCFLKNHDMPIPPTMVTGRRIRIMIVDEPRVSNRIANAIKKAHPDYDVTEVSDAFMAGAVAATQTPDVIIMDLSIPAVDGFRMCRQIKSHQLMKKAEVFAMTSVPSKEVRRKILTCGARSCFTKPLNLTLLLTEVEAVVKPNGINDLS